MTVATSPVPPFGTGPVAARLRRLLPATLAVPLVLAASSSVILGAGVFKGQCLSPWEAGSQYRIGCYNDIQALYGIRGTADGVFPYVEGSLVNGEPVNGAFEYPVLTGTFTWLPGVLSDTVDSYFFMTMLLLAPFGVYASWQLARMVGYRALYVAASPTVIWYAFLNWDLLVVAAAVAGTWQWYRGRLNWAAFFFGVGACLKLYPGLFLLPLALYAWRRRGFGTAVEATSIGVLTVAAINLPFILIHRPGWLAILEFQSRRNADISTNSIWFWGFPDITRETLNVLTPGLMAASWAAAAAYGLWRARREGSYPLVQVCGAMVVSFILWNKVHSPQYGLWVLPFFALLRLRWGWWAAFVFTDTLLFWGIFRWFYQLGIGKDFTNAKQMLVLGVWGQAAMLVLLYVMFLRSRSAFDEEPATPAESPAESPTTAEREPVTATRA